MEDYFTSDQFCGVVAKLKNQDDIQKASEALINLSFVFVRLNVKVSKKDLTKYLDAVVTKYKENKDNKEKFNVNELNEIGYQSASKYFCKKNNLDPNSEEALQIANERMSKMYKFHATNGANLENIQQNGLDPKANNEYQEEIDSVLNIFVDKAKENDLEKPTMLFGWQKLNCENKISFSQTPSVSYDYAARSPEWFSQFVGGSINYDKTDPKFTPASFANRDYEGAKRNVAMLIEKHKLDDEQKVKVMDFFEKYWNKFAKSNNPTLIVIPEDKKNDEINAQINYSDFVENKENVKVSGIVSDIERLMSDAVDGQTTEKIDTSKAKYFEFPSLNLLKEKVAEIEKKQNAGVSLEDINEEESISI